MTLWDALRVRREGFNSYCMTALLAAGFGSCRRWLSLSLGDVPPGAWPAGLDLQSVSSLVSAACFLAAALAARRLAPVVKRGTWVFGFAALLGLGSALMLEARGPAMCLVGVAVSQLGFACMYMVWMEAYGCFEPARMALAYEASTLVNGLVWAGFQHIDREGLPLAYALVPALSSLALLVVLANMPAARMPAEKASVPLRPLWKLVAWVAAFGAAFGMGDAVTGMAISSSASYIGRAIPSLVVVAGLLLAPRAFDIGLLYRVSVLFVVFGFAASFLQTGFSQALLSASLESCTVLAFITICGAAYHRRESAAFVSGALFAVQEAAVQLGKLAYGAAEQAAGATGAGGGAWAAAMAAVAVGVVAAACLFLFNERAFSQAWGIRALSPREGSGENGGRQASLDEFCRRFSISPQERNVVALMREGMSAQEISDELFIAPGTVRSHVSRVYGKAGVHSRGELEALLDRMGTGGRA